MVNGTIASYRDRLSDDSYLVIKKVPSPFFLPGWDLNPDLLNNGAVLCRFRYQANWVLASVA